MAPEESPSYTVDIKDQTLLLAGFDKWIFPLNGNGTQLILNNNRFRKITYVDFDKHNTIEKTVKVFRDKILEEQHIQDPKIIDSLCTCLQNICVDLQDDKGFFKNISGNGHGNGKTTTRDHHQGDEDARIVAENKLTEQDIRFVIDTMKKEAEYDVLSIKQLFYGMASAFTKGPIHHIVNSKEAGAGKNYLLELVSRYWPDKYVFPLGNITDKAIFHRKGMLVIIDQETGEEKPLKPKLDDLNLQIEELKDEINDEKSKPDSKDRDKKLISENNKQIIKIGSQIEDLKNNAQKIIDLDNQIIMCLDTPKSSLYDAIMSIVSQDTPKDQEYSFVDENAIGKLTTRNNKIRGTPVIIPTQVVDDTKNERFAEKNRRFINVNPETTNKKIHAAKRITALQGGYLPEEYDELVVSRSDKERTKKITQIIVSKLKTHSKNFNPKEHGVKIPFALSIHESIPSDQLWGMTVMDRTIKYLSIITKVNMDFRPRIQNTQTGQFFPIAITADLKQTLELMKVAASAVRPYIAAWYNKIFLPCISDLDGKPNEQLAIDENGNPRMGLDGKPIVLAKERRVGVNTEQLALKHKQVLNKKPGDGEILYKYLYPLRSQGVINSDKSEIDGRENIWSPVEEGTLFNIFSEESSSSSSSFADDFVFVDSGVNLKLKVSKPEARAL